MLACNLGRSEASTVITLTRKTHKQTTYVQFGVLLAVLLSFFLFKMNSKSYAADEGREDIYSLPPRSRAGSGVSTTESLFQGLHIVESPPTTYLETSRPTSSQGLAPSPAYSSHFSPRTSPYLSTNASQHHSSPFPSLSDSVLHADWFDLPAQPEVTPILRVDPAQDYSQRQTRSPSLTSQSATMRYEEPPRSSFSCPTPNTLNSTAAIQFDPGFNHFSMGSRSSFTWPGKSMIFLLRHSFLVSY